MKPTSLLQLSVCAFALMVNGSCTNDPPTSVQNQRVVLSSPTVFVQTGILKSPQGITADAQGNVWIADTWNSKLRKFNTAGVQVDSIDTPASKPNNVSIHRTTGDLLVVLNENRFDRFIIPTKTVLTSILLDPFSGDASVVFDVNTRTIQQIIPSVTQLGDIDCSSAGDVFITAHGVPQNFLLKITNGNVYVIASSSLAPEPPAEIGARFAAVDASGIVYTSFTILSAASQSVTRVCPIDPSNTNQSGPMNDPVVTGAARGAGLDAGGNLYVVEPNLQELVIVSTSSGKTIERYTIGDVPGLSLRRAPQDVAVAADGTVYVVLNDLQNPTSGPGAVIRYTRIPQ